MRILIISRGYPTEKYSLNGIFEYDQAKALAQAGHEVIIAAIDMRSIRRWRKWGYENSKKDGVSVEAINIPCGRMPNNILNKIRERSLIRLYSRIVKQYGKPDIIHSHFISTGYITVNLFKDKGIPLVHTEHYSGMNQKGLSDYYQFLGNNTYSHFNRILVVSNHLGNNIKNEFGVNFKLIPNVVDIGTFEYKTFRNYNKKFEFISVGSLLKNKRMNLLIKAFSDVFKYNTDVILYIYGEGPEREKLEELVKQLNLTKHVFLMGLVDRKTIAKKMQESHCFVLASKLETFGVVYIEAMSTGLPVIATKCGGPEDFVNTSNGILVPVDDQKQLSKAMRNMLNNISDYDNKKISNEIREKFSSKSIADQLTETYLEEKNRVIKE